ncbi:SGNH/GDSL hydrolase family protein [Methylocystis sp. Sn-Cys]|uniref:SGNH/GDSL hydrolase family protein n=1 Tax=Methylocystis sp. Sn-Cys TaxID=1701263 RepID=UPI0019209706|nr:SGNH/GDSL hydrolase family protein [Methylocystis sp. Sn-Cys]MBL1257413.1 SGNH/GDSL hydrolase family protein [Methylocystis sp. Sn-Cys]
MLRLRFAVLLPNLRRAFFLLAVVTGLGLLSLKRSDAPTVDCSLVNDGPNNYRILVVGESWASDGKIFPDLPRTVSERLDGRGVRACSIGFNGRNSRLLYAELRKKFPKDRLSSLFEGNAPDKVILMTGVNDAIQHIGASAYVEFTEKLVDYFSDASEVEIVSIPRVNERWFKPPNLFSLIKRTIFRCLYDGCDYQVNDVYRVALWRDHPHLQTIEFDNFIDKFEGHEDNYTLDGVHLTDAAYHKYGSFIGSAMTLARNDTARR